MTLRKGIFLTAWNRPHYFQRTLESWEKVRGVEDWYFLVRLAPSPFVQEHLDIIAASPLDVRVHLNSQTEGVLHHPWVGFEDFFSLYFDFVVRAEDDLIVSDDILEYFNWASESYYKDREIATVLALCRNEGRDNEVERTERFNPWVWGTWHDRWTRHIRDTWDHDYSTYNGSPGNEAGWDWNLDTRVFPQNGLKSIRPLNSRVQNIGMWGVHGTPDNWQMSFSFHEHYAPQDYVEA